jgi:hypothetical protein
MTTPPLAPNKYPALKFDNLDADGKIRKLNAELAYVKSELEQHRRILGQILTSLATVAEHFPGAPTDSGAELRALRFDFDQRRHPDPDFYRTPT